LTSAFTPHYELVLYELTITRLLLGYEQKIERARNARDGLGGRAVCVYLPGAASAGAGGEQGLKLGDELVDLLVGDVATRRPPAGHPRLVVRSPAAALTDHWSRAGGAKLRAFSQAWRPGLSS
jgi:hypothetical protein